MREDSDVAGNVKERGRKKRLTALRRIVVQLRHDLLERYTKVAKAAVARTRSRAMEKCPGMRINWRLLLAFFLPKHARGQKDDALLVSRFRIIAAL